MRNKTTYEWRVNQVDEHGDINDIAFFDTYAEAANFMCLFDYQEIELTRTVDNDDEGIVQRDYATVDFKHWELPETFDHSAIKVPAAKKAEVRKWHKQDLPVICKSRETMESSMAPLLESGEYEVKEVEEKDYDGKVYEIREYYTLTSIGLCGAVTRRWADGSDYRASINQGLARKIFSAS